MGNIVENSKDSHSICSICGKKINSPHKIFLQNVIPQYAHLTCHYDKLKKFMDKYGRLWDFPFTRKSVIEMEEYTQEMVIELLKWKN
jgi:hypothetical protein